MPGSQGRKLLPLWGRVLDKQGLQNLVLAQINAKGQAVIMD
ncbi:MAG: hypothetical protein ACK4QL_04870 [Pseudanabaenaceae cyanobacterium]